MKLHLVLLLGLLAIGSVERINCEKEDAADDQDLKVEGPAKLVELVELVKPVELAELVEPAEPAELAETADSDEPAEPAEPTQPPTLVPVVPFDPEEAAEEEADKEATRNNVLEDLTPTLSYIPINQVNMEEALYPGDGQNAIDELICGPYFSRVYRRIDDFLVKEVEGGKAAYPEDSMKMAVQRLQEEEAKPSILNKCFLPALRQFTALVAPVDPNNKCSWDRFRIIYMNDRATNGRTHRSRSKIGKLRHVEKLIHKYAYDHATACHDVYPTLFNEIYATIDKNVLHNVELFTDGIIKNYKLNNSKFWIFDFKKWFKADIDIINVLRDIRHVHHNQDGVATLEVLEELAKDDPDADLLQPHDYGLASHKPLMREDKVKEMLVKYIAIPCQNYMEQLGPRVYIPASYSETLLDKNDRYQAKEGGELFGFLTGWIRIRICDMLNRRDINALVKKVTKAAFHKAKQLKKNDMN